MARKKNNENTIIAKIDNGKFANCGIAERRASLLREVLAEKLKRNDLADMANHILQEVRKMNDAEFNEVKKQNEEE